jgi:hypothetical protein
MLAEARSLDDIRQVHNLAQRAQDYAKAARLGLDAQNSAAAIALEAEAKAGDLLTRMRATGERATPQTANPTGKTLPSATREAPTLADLGVTENESRVWQAVSQVPAEDRAAYVADAQEREQEVTRAGLLRQAKVAAGRTNRQRATTLEEAVFTPAEMARRRLEGVVSLELLPAAEKVSADSDYLTQQERAVIQIVVDKLAQSITHMGLRVVNGAR